MKTLIAFLFFSPGLVLASPAKFGIDIKKSSIHYFLPYSTGTSEGDVRAVDGSVTLDPDHPSAVSGEFTVPISSIDSGSAKRTCHLQEALGLNYAVSDFPNDHVCDGDKLPLTGKNSVVFTTIHFKVLKITSMTEAASIEVEGEWVIHGVSHSDHLKMKMIREGTGLRLKGETQFSLKNYGIVVKPAKIAFITISVHDELRVVLDLLLTPTI